jgi:hypothetical protein
MANGSFGVRAPQDFAAGAFLVAVGLFAFWQASDLPAGTLRAIGPGMLPRSVAAMVGLGGITLAAYSFFEDGPRMERWRWRGPFFILGGIILFALTIRPLGLIVAGPLAMFFGSMGSEEFRWKESIIFSIVLTALCILLFKAALRLPIPVAPFL